MNIETILTDPDLGGTEFAILRKTWTQESGLPKLVDLQVIYAYGSIHPAEPTQLNLLPEEYRQEPLLLIHSTEPLSLGESLGPEWTSPDEVRWNDQLYRLFRLQPWQAYGFWTGWAVRASEGDAL